MEVLYIYIYIRFDDEKAGSKSKHANQNFVPIERVEAKFSVSKKQKMSTTTRTQFPLLLAYACTVHKVQGLTLNKVVISFNLERQRNFNPGQIYVAFSRPTSLNGLFCTGHYNKSAIHASQKVHEEYTRLRKRDNLLLPLKSLIQTESSLTISLLNIRSFKRHVKGLIGYGEIMNSDVLLLTETHIDKFDHTNVTTSLDKFTVYPNNDINKYKSQLIGTDQVFVKVTSFQKWSGFTLLQMKKSLFSDDIMSILLVYRCHSESLHKFLTDLSSIKLAFNLDMIFGDFNIDFQKETREKFELLNVLDSAEFTQIVDHPTHIDGGLIDHIYIKKTFLEIFSVEFIKICVTVSDHDALKVRVKFLEEN